MTITRIYEFELFFSFSFWILSHQATKNNHFLHQSRVAQRNFPFDP